MACLTWMTMAVLELHGSQENSFGGCSRSSSDRRSRQHDHTLLFLSPSGPRRITAPLLSAPGLSLLALFQRLNVSPSHTTESSTGQFPAPKRDAFYRKHFFSGFVDAALSGLGILFRIYRRKIWHAKTVTLVHLLE